MFYCNIALILFVLHRLVPSFIAIWKMHTDFMLVRVNAISTEGRLPRVDVDSLTSFANCPVVHYGMPTKYPLSSV